MVFVFCIPKLGRSILTCRQCYCLLNLYSTKEGSTLLNLLNKTFVMPKPTPHTVALKKHRQKLKEKSLKYNPGTVNLQVLGSGAHGAPRCLYVFTDQSRYLFNCGEGTQRLAHEHKMKLSKLEHIFVTHTSWENVGGLPGVALTIQDVGVPQVTLHGPPGTDLVFSGTRRFVVLRHLAVKMASCERDAMFKDNVMKVRYVPLYNAAGRVWRDTPPSERSRSVSPDRNNPDDSTDDDIDYYAYWNNGARSRSNSPSRSGSPGRSKKRRHLSPENRCNPRNLPPPGSMSMAYICKLQDRPGTLDLKACVARGVPPGPLLGQLKAGEDVQLSNGTIVLSKDVTSPDEPGPVFIVVECPSEEFLDSLAEEELFRRHQSVTADTTEAAALVVHFTPASVMQHPRYREWMAQFPPSTHHLTLNDSSSCLGSVAVHRIQHKLRLLSEEMFPTLADQGILDAENGPLPQNPAVNGSDDLRKSFSIIPGHTLTTVPLRPQRAVDGSPKLRLEPEVWRQEALAVEGFPEELAALRERLAALPEEGEEYPHVVFLGTGSCIPSKTRNTSGILVNLSESTSMIMDCGEATYGQLVRLYGPRTTQVLQGVRAIYVSHLHADHHIGLVALLRAPRHRPLYLVAPRQIRTWLHTYHSHFQPIMDGVTLVPNDQLLYTSPTLDPTVETELLDSLGLSALRTCAVRHCPNAFGVAVTTRDGWKLTYSGDTMPCDELVALGYDSHLLIHEATMEDDLESEARIKMHSTTSQAIEVGRRMGAKFTLLTHFSQRYAKVPMFSDSFTPDVGVAFDNMRVRLRDVAKLPKMYGALKLMFADHYEEMELKAFKRQMQLEREQAKAKT